MIEKLTWMEGETYSTLAQNKKFTVIDVNSNSIEIKVRGTENIRRISKKEIEIPWQRLLREGRLTRQQIFDMGSRSSAYIVTILAKIPGVTYKLNPIQLYYKDPT